MVIAALSLLPYVGLKVLWLSGSDIGMVPGANTSHMQDARMEIGNIVTVGLAGVGVILVLALAQRWGERLPWWFLVLPAAAATGALAPIALGLPMGLLLQAVVTGLVTSGGEGDLMPAVFAVVYGGFAIYGLALALLFADYAHRRWRALLAAAPRPPQPVLGRALPAAAIGSFSALVLVWALGPSSRGLAGWDSLAQRTVLVVVALLSVMGCAALLKTEASRPRVRWVLGWIGCSTAAVQGPTLLLLAQDATINITLVAVTLLATPAATWLGLSALNRSRGRLDAPSDASPASSTESSKIHRQLH